MGLGKGLALSAIVVARVTESGVEAPARPLAADKNVAIAAFGRARWPISRRVASSGLSRDRTGVVLVRHGSNVSYRPSLIILLLLIASGGFEPGAAWNLS